MNTNKLTLKQVRTIRENGYLGAPDRKGKQKDYHDYREDIDKRYWTLMDRKNTSSELERRSQNAPEAPKNDFRLEVARDILTEQINRAFRPWRVLGYKAQEVTV